MEKESISITSSNIGPGITRILLQGQLVIKNSAEIKSKLLIGLQSSYTLEVGLKNITKIDVAIVQLLIGLQKSAGSLKKKLLFDLELSAGIQSVLQHSDLEKALLINLNSEPNAIH